MSLVCFLPVHLQGFYGWLITRIISKQLDIKLGPFTQEELDSVLRKIKNRKAAGLDEIPPRSMEDQTIRRHTAPTLQRSI